ncbi:MAG: fructosamine kinase family protein [Planctomycetota bacterium]
MTPLDELARALGGTGYTRSLLAHGRTGEVLRIDVAGAPPRVAKLDPSGEGGLEVEAEMLRYIASEANAPVPGVEYGSRHVLLMEWRPGTTGVATAAADDAAAALAALHAVGGATFGFDRATRIGGLVQPNPERTSWLEFFAEARLVAPVREARDERRIDASIVGLVEHVAGRVGEFAGEPAAPALLHGDLWSGNVLTEGDRLTAFLDPALYRGHPEVDLAFATMFGGFPNRFFDAYRERASARDDAILDAGFWSTRRDLWNLYPLLVHVRLFGGSYVDDLVRTARRFA